jgi:hypothetical protein
VKVGVITLQWWGCVRREKDEYDVQAEIVGELSAALTLTNSTGTINCGSLNYDLVN